MPGTTMIEIAPMVSAGTSAGRARCRRSLPRRSPCRRSTCVRRRRVPKCRPYRHAANSGRSGAPTRNKLEPVSQLRETDVVGRDANVRAAKRPLDSSIASQRSSSGERFQRPQWWHTTHSRPFAESNARRRPTGKCSIVSFVPRSFAQNRHVEYMLQTCAKDRALGQWIRANRRALYNSAHDVTSARHRGSASASPVSGRDDASVGRHHGLLAAARQLHDRRDAR